MKRLITLLALLIVAFATSRIPALYHAYTETDFQIDRDLLCAFTDRVEGERRIPGIAVENEKDYPIILSDPERYEDRLSPACESATVVRHFLDRAKELVSVIHDSVKTLLP